MKRLFSYLFTLIVVIVAASLIYNQFADRNLETDITIEAPAAEVWAVLLNHEAYPDWNPFVKEISGPTAVGETLQVTLQPEGRKAMSFEPVVLANEDNREFRWKGKLYVNGIFDGEHYFLLEPLGDEGTKFIQGENFTGVFSGAITTWMGEGTEAGFKAMNEALKERAEAAWKAKKTAAISVTDSVQ